MHTPLAVNGLLVIDKPLRMTSRDAVNRAWRWLPRGTRIGHTGTLDPLATGVLVVCAGVATRLAEYVQQMEKVYRAGLCLGARSSTDDGEGTLTVVPDAAPPSLADVTQMLETFLGTILQVPPEHSAAKVSGHRAYKMARKGHAVTLAPRSVLIHALTILEYCYPRLDLEVRCGKGTYIRSLARDLGARLGCGAYLTSLRRTRVGPFRAEHALALEADAQTARSQLLPLADAVQALPRLTLTEEEAALLQAGQGVPIPPDLDPGNEVAGFSRAGTLLVIGKVDRDKGLILPHKVLRA